LCFEKSFASSPYAKYWSSSNNLPPSKVFKHAGGSYWFDCPKCKHTFKGMLNNISKNHWCGYCNSSKLCEDLECKACFDNSFASHHRAKFWSKKNKKTPRQVSKANGAKFWFYCDKNKDHTFETSIDHITCSGRWCPWCKNKTEDKLFNWLIKLYPAIKRQQKFDWCINQSSGKHLRYDFYIPAKKILIELDGPQHFRQVSNWTTPQEIQKRDHTKDLLAAANGFTLIRVLQEDVLSDLYDWETLLINSMSRSRKHSTLTHIYNNIEKDVEYIYELNFISC